MGEVGRRHAPPAGRRSRRDHARALGPPGLAWAGPACWCPARGPASRRCASSSSRWAGCPLPGPFFSSAVMATLAARALGADEPAGGPGLRRHQRGRWPCTSRVTAIRWARSGPGPGARASGWVVTGTKPLVRRRPHRRLGHRGGAGRGGDPLVPAAGAQGRAGPGARPHPQAGPAGARRGAGRAARAAAATRPRCGGGSSTTSSVALAAELVGVADRALEEAVEYAKVRVVFDRPIASFQVGQAPDRRHVPRPGDGPGRGALRRLGRRHRRARAVAGCGHGRRPTPPRPR